MGWASGSELLGTILEAFEVEDLVPIDAKRRIYRRMIEAFEDRDCDTIEECLGIDDDFDEVWYEIYPSDESG